MLEAMVGMVLFCFVCGLAVTFLLGGGRNPARRSFVPQTTNCPSAVCTASRDNCITGMYQEDAAQPTQAHQMTARELSMMDVRFDRSFVPMTASVDHVEVYPLENDTPRALPGRHYPALPEGDTPIEIGTRVDGHWVEVWR